MSALCLYVSGFFFGTPLCKFAPPCRGEPKNARGVPKYFGSLRSPVRTPLSKTLKPPLDHFYSTFYQVIVIIVIIIYFMTHIKKIRMLYIHIDIYINNTLVLI